MFLFIFERERQSIGGGGAEREGDAESQAGPRVWDVSTEPDVGLEPTDREIMTWAEIEGLTDWATQVPKAFIFSFANGFYILSWIHETYPWKSGENCLLYF